MYKRIAIVALAPIACAIGFSALAATEAPSAQASPYCKHNYEPDSQGRVGYYDCTDHSGNPVYQIPGYSGWFVVINGQLYPANDV